MQVKFVVEESGEAGVSPSGDDLTWNDEMDRRDLPKRAADITHEGSTFTVTDVTTGTFDGQTHAVLRLRRTAAA